VQTRQTGTHIETTSQLGRALNYRLCGAHKLSPEFSSSGPMTDIRHHQINTGQTVHGPRYF
jgi:hypothetical protein